MYTTTPATAVDWDREAREMAARLIAHANAVKAHRPVPEYARTPNGAAIERGFGLTPFQWKSGST